MFGFVCLALLLGYGKFFICLATPVSLDGKGEGRPEMSAGGCQMTALATEVLSLTTSWSTEQASCRCPSNVLHRDFFQEPDGNSVTLAQLDLGLTTETSGKVTSSHPLQYGHLFLRI